MVDVLERPARPSATRQWQKHWRIDRARGLKRTTGPERAQAHVTELITRYGVSIRAIADTAGTAPSLISELNRGICKGMKVTTEQKILTVSADQIFARSNDLGFVPNTGARRRVQALMAIGWRHQDLAPRLGFRTTNITYQAGDWICRKKHDAIKRLYDRLWNVRGPAKAISLARVAKAGYAPPLAWDDDTIDDPNATPNFGTKVARQGPRPPSADVIHYSDAIAEDVDFLNRTGATTEEIQARTGHDWRSIERTLYRAGRGDLVTAVKNPIRDNARKAGHPRRAA